MADDADVVVLDRSCWSALFSAGCYPLQGVDGGDGGRALCPRCAGYYGEPAHDSLFCAVRGRWAVPDGRRGRAVGAAGGGVPAASRCGQR